MPAPSVTSVAISAAGQFSAWTSGSAQYAKQGGPGPLEPTGGTEDCPSTEELFWGDAGDCYHAETVCRLR